MKIAIDLHGLQTPGSRNRGIGRYVRSLLESLLEKPGTTEYILIANGFLPTPELSLPKGMVINTIPFQKEGEGEYNDLLYKTFLLAADVDAVFLPSSIEMADSAMTDFTDFPATLYVVWYDLVPLIFADRYLPNEDTRVIYTRMLRNVRSADRAFAISESARQDLIRHLEIPSDSTINIGAGVSPFFSPISAEEGQKSQATLSRKFGIVRPFVLYTGGEDWRKNIEGLICGFAALPKDVRERYQLVVACRMSKLGEEALVRLARGEGLASDAVIFTDYVTDDELRALYSTCALFVFPSIYEGFGLPLAEAIACGAPAIAANASSLPEIVTDSDRLFDPLSPVSIADCMRRALGDEPFLRRARESAAENAAKFAWDSVASKIAAVFAEDSAAITRPAETLTMRRIHLSQGRQNGTSTLPKASGQLAFFSPLLPIQSGISDYSDELLPALSEHFDIDLYIDQGYWPVTQALHQLPCFCYTAFDRIDETQRRDYRAIVYQMGNSDNHLYMYHLMQRYAGITVLHDYNLSGMLDYASHHRRSFDITLAEELAHAYGEPRSKEIVSDIADRKYGVADLPAMGIYCNRRIFTRSLGVIVHSHWAYDMAIREHSDICDHIAIVPHEMTAGPQTNNPDEILHLRRKYGVPAEAFVFSSCGIVAASKRPLQILDAFQAHLATHPNSYLVFAGPVYMESDFPSEIHQRGLSERVLVTGYLEGTSAFHEMVRLSDACIALRYPSNGETSGSLLRMLAEGRPTIVTNIGSFADYPDNVVHKVPPPNQCDEVAAIVEAMRLLADNAEYRLRLGREAADYVRREHAPEHCARLYHEFIERVLADPWTRHRLLADYVGRGLAKISGVQDPVELFAPYKQIFANYSATMSTAMPFRRSL